MHRRTASFLLCVALVTGCRGRDTEARQAAVEAAKAEYTIEAGAAIRIPYAVYPEVVHPVLIRGPGGTRRIPGLFVADSAALAAAFDSLAFAAAFDSGGAMVGLMRFHSLSGRIDTLPAPHGYSPNLTSLAVSRDGRYMAYVEVDGGAPPYGVVRRVSDQSDVIRMPPVAVLGSSAQVGIAKWLDADRFLLAVAVDASRDRWIRFRVEVGARKVVQDTVTGGTLASGP